MLIIDLISDKDEGVTEQMELLEKLNPVQREAVVHEKGPLLILAGAGSGKTRTLTHRIAYLLQQGVSPYHILAITFTNKAAREMKSRMESLTDEGNQVWVSTFHSTCVRILRREIGLLDFDSSFTIYDADDSERLLKACIQELNLSDKLYPVKSLQYFISAQKNELITSGGHPLFGLRESGRAGEEQPDGFRLKKMYEVYTLYQKKLKGNNALDFDDLIFRTVELFYYHPEVLEKYQQRFQYILVDEYQDTNTAQYRLIMLLAEKYKNLCVVGDDDQSIYGWRGADIRNILDFEKDFPTARVIKLEQNYRSSQTILDAANAVIAHNTSRKRKSLWTDKGGGTAIHYYKAPSETDEAAFITGEIERAYAQGEGYGSFSILYRNNAQSRVLEEQLLYRSIPYRLFGGVRFYERKEIKDILSYLRAIHNPRDQIAYTRIINVPRRGIGETSVQKIADYAATRDISFFDALKQAENIPGLAARSARLVEFRELMGSLAVYAENHTAAEVLEKTVADTGYAAELLMANNEESLGRLENIEELMTKAADFEEKAEDKSLGAFLEDVALVADIDGYAEDQEAVVLMTLHSSKGLEFPQVFITGFEEGIFPSYRSVMSASPHAIEEERRLCYVGITRAMTKLYITSALSRRQYGQTVYNSPSRFLKEIPVDLLGNQMLGAKKMKENESQRGISQFAEINKSKNSIDISFGAKNYANIPEPKAIELNFGIGDNVRHMKYGVGQVKEISPAGADYEVSVEFPQFGLKKVMATLSRLKKVE